MPVETFTKEQFEAALPKDKDGNELWSYLEQRDGEHVYTIAVQRTQSSGGKLHKIDTNKRIVVRSSVHADGVSAETGKDSIRLWIEYHYKGAWRPLKKHKTRWTTRVPGWQQRMTDKLRELYQIALDDCKRNSNNNNTATAQSSSSGLAELDADTQAIKSAQQQEGESDPLDFLSDEKIELVTDDSDIDDTELALAKDEIELELDDHAMLPVSDEELTELAIKLIKSTKEPNPEQLTAITAPIDAAVRVLAPPGAGKTFVIARRYAYLLEHGVSPGNILAVTFSKDMATDLLNRILNVNPSARGTSAEQQICTIHAACYRELVAAGDNRRVPKMWQLKKAVQELAEQIWTIADERPGWTEIMSWINSAKAHALTTTDDLDYFITTLAAMGCDDPAYHGRKLHEIRRKLDNRLRRERALTFADMLYDFEIKLTRDPAFLSQMQAKYQYVIVDEGQDTTAQAMRVLTLIAAPQDRFFIVGDTDQLLYRFAGATPEANLYEGFEQRFPDGILVKLLINYRSTHEIIDKQMQLIAQNYAQRGGPYDDKYLKDVRARDDAPEGEPITFSMYPNAEQEACALVDALKTQLESGRKPGEFFVGARTRAQLGYLEGPLTRAKVPFINVTGSSFWASKHVADVVAYVKLAHDENDDQAFSRVYNIGSNWCAYPWGDKQGEYCTHRFLGRAFLSACKDYSTGQPSFKWVWKAARSKRSFNPGVSDLAELVGSIRADIAAADDKDKAAAAVQSVLDNCYDKWLRHEEGITASDESENGKLEDLATVLDVASQFDSIADFVTYVNDALKAAQAVKDKDWADYVVISTVHRLKGLERPIVYGVGLAENGMQGLLPHTFSMTAPPQFGVLPTGGVGRVADERCIAFVLVSRAKEQVHLSGIERYRKLVLKESRFVHEMELDVVGSSAEREIDPALLDSLSMRDDKHSWTALHGELWQCMRCGLTVAASGIPDSRHEQATACPGHKCTDEKARELGYRSEHSVNILSEPCPICGGAVAIDQLALMEQHGEGYAHVMSTSTEKELPVECLGCGECGEWLDLELCAAQQRKLSAKIERALESGPSACPNCGIPTHKLTMYSERAYYCGDIDGCAHVVRIDETTGEWEAFVE